MKRQIKINKRLKKVPRNTIVKEKTLKNTFIKE